LRQCGIVGFLAIASLYLSFLLLIASVVKADSYTIDTPNGAKDTLTIKNYEDSDTANFSFTDPDDTIQGIGTGQLHVFGIFDTDSYNASLVEASFTDTSTNDTTDLIETGGGTFMFDLLSKAPVFSLYAYDGENYLTYSTTSLVYAGTDSTPANTLPFTYSTGGGSYTRPAPEMNGDFLFGILLSAGGCAVALRRKLTS